MLCLPPEVSPLSHQAVCVLPLSWKHTPAQPLPSIHESGNTIGISWTTLHNSLFPVCADARAATQFCLFVCVRFCVSGCGYPSYLRPSLIFHCFSPISLCFPCSQSHHLDAAGCLSALCSHPPPHVTYTYTQFPCCKLAHMWAASSKNRLVVTLVPEHLEHAAPRRWLHHQHDRYSGRSAQLWLLICLRRLRIYVCVNDPNVYS